MPRRTCLSHRRHWPWPNAVNWWEEPTRGATMETTKQWYAQAKGWYEKAKAAHPDDFSIVRRLTEFFCQTKQMAKAEAQLDAILKRGAEPQNAETVAWARRTLALTLAPRPTASGSAMRCPYWSQAVKPPRVPRQRRPLKIQRTCGCWPRCWMRKRPFSTANGRLRSWNR